MRRLTFVKTKLKAAEKELLRNMIMVNLDEKRTVHELHELTGIPKEEIAEYVIALLRWRRIEQVGMRGRSSHIDRSNWRAKMTIMLRGELNGCRG